jgi:diadenosine tetraphosphatase ApaH/serine/threonine PP2A family protein phosphatase
MRYAIFTDIHANLEALEAVLKKIDEIAREKPIDQIWFLGDLVGYGPNPNECITTLRERTDVIIAGNHDWAAVGKIDLEDFSAAARVSAEWTAEQLTEEHRTFLANLPERLEINECTLVHGSPYGPLWEYLTSEVLAERSFQYFSSRFCFVGHTHVPVIFQQPDSIANAPTLPLVDVTKNGLSHYEAHEEEPASEAHNEDKAEMAMIQPMLSSSKTAAQAESAYADPETGQSLTEEDANTVIESGKKGSDRQDDQDSNDSENAPTIEKEIDAPRDASNEVDQTQAHAVDGLDDVGKTGEAASKDAEEEGMLHDVPSVDETDGLPIDDTDDLEEHGATEVEDVAGGEEESDGVVKSDEVTPEEVILSAEDRLNSEIEELLSLLGFSESMIQVSNEMIIPPEGHWEALAGFRAIINPGGVGQPRDGDPRAAFMIYDTEAGYEFYRVPYAFEQTQEKIVKVGLPQYLAIRLAVGR